MKREKFQPEFVLATAICTEETFGVDAKLDTMLVDYGAVNALPSAIDAVTLELGAFFHRLGFRNKLRWSPGDGRIDWSDRDGFSARTMVPNIIPAARPWAHAEGFGGREVLACAYACVLRQLQFSDTDKELAVALIAGNIGNRHIGHQSQ